MINNRRALIRMSQEALAARAGVSKSTVFRLGKPGQSAPSRTMAIDLAHAVGVDVDEALALLGYGPVSDAERALLSPAGDPWLELEALRSSLTVSRLWALVHVARSMVDPAAPMPSDGGPGEVVTVLTASTGAAERARGLAREASERLGD